MTPEQVAEWARLLERRKKDRQMYRPLAEWLVVHFLEVEQAIGDGTHAGPPAVIELRRLVSRWDEAVEKAYSVGALKLVRRAGIPLVDWADRYGMTLLGLLRQGPAPLAHEPGCGCGPGDVFTCRHCGNQVAACHGAADEVERQHGPICDECAAKLQDATTPT